MTEPTVIDPLELRANPELLREMREQPGKHVERRIVPLQRIDVEKRSADGTWKGGGLAAVYDQRSHNLGGFVEQIARGAFRKVLTRTPDVRALFNHDPNKVLARTSAGTLRVEEVGKGLDYEFDAPATGPGTEVWDYVRLLMERGDVTQSSFAFRLAPNGDSWEEDPETGILVRTIHEFGELFDVSPVTDPAYPDATSGIRSADPAFDDLLAQVRGLGDERLHQFMEQMKENDLRSVSQQGVRGVASQPDDQGDTGDGLAQVEEQSTRGGMTVAARERRLRMLALMAG